MSFEPVKHPTTLYEENLARDIARQSDVARNYQQARAARALMEIDLAALRHNIRLASRLSSGAKLMAVVKGDAYGLGAGMIANTLGHCNAHAFAVDSVAEGISLRAAGIKQPILILNGDVPDNALLAIEYQLMPSIADEDLLSIYEDVAAQYGKRYPIWLIANVGFNRAGYREIDAFIGFARRACECRHLKVLGIYAHLTNANDNAKVSLEQIEAFREVVNQSKGIFGKLLETSLFASHGLMRWADAVPTDWVRAGIMLYGEHSFEEAMLESEALLMTYQLKPAIRLRARIIHLLSLNGGEPVGYGQRHRASAGQRLATVSIGFGSGYPSGTHSSHILLRGRRAPLFGEVGMDVLQIDVTDIPDAKLYDWVTLIGTDGEERISVYSLARNAGMTSYQLLRQLNCARLYVDSENSND